MGASQVLIVTYNTSFVEVGISSNSVIIINCRVMNSDTVFFKEFSNENVQTLRHSLFFI